MAKQQPQKASTPQPPVAAAPIPLLQPRAFGAVDQPSLGESPQADMESKLDGVALGHSLGRINTRPLSHLPIQPKLTIGQVGDPYEQEADRVAAQVVSQINAPKPQTAALPKLQSKAALRRKALSVSIQRQEAPEEDELQMKPLAESIQRSEAPEEEDELQMKPLAESIQRQEAPEEDELQMKPLAESIQRSEAPEEDELQMKPTVQRKADPGGSAASANLETSINQARGGGQGMSDSIRQPMEQAFGADFSSVRVHTGSQADQLSRSINAQAFTTKNDIFFSQGAYNPGDRGGQELLAHELTHVVQQTQKPTQQANGQTLSPKKAPTPLAQSLNIQNNRPTVQKKDGYDNLKKSEDPEVIWHKALGKELVATYRILSSITSALGKDKNKAALKEAAIGLAKAGLSIATMLTGIPGLAEGTDALNGDIVLNTGLDTLGQTAVKTGGGLGLGAMESNAPNLDVQRGVQNTTTGGALKSKIYAKVGNLENAANTLLGFIPFFGAAKSLAKGAKQAMLSEDDWNDQKGVLLRGIREIEVAMQDAISEVNIDNFGDLEIVTANSKLFMLHSRRTLQEVLTKYQAKSEALRKAADSWSEKHEEHVNLLTPELES